MTDLEAVAGVINFFDWCYPTGRYYDRAKELLTLEANAAIEGFFAAGAECVTLCDGHGYGGLAPHLLDARAEFLTGFNHVPYPLGLTAEYDVAAWVGQHSMAGTPYGHLAHTGSEGVLEVTFNGNPIGEIGEFAYAAAELGVRAIFLSGDRAGCEEAEALIPGIETVAVKEGLSAFRGLESPLEDAQRDFTAARHLSPLAARERIRKGAEYALHRARKDRDMGRLMLPPAPYSMKTVYRNTKEGSPGGSCVHTHPDSFIALMNAKHGL